MRDLLIIFVVPSFQTHPNSFFCCLGCHCFVKVVLKFHISTTAG